MPWRAAAGETPDPYRVWLSEVMLQQTTVAAVVPYFERFLQRFPTVAALAAAPEEAVLQAWAGLGYYARARNLHRCAGLVAGAGGFPRDLAGLRALPGVGDYTASAVASIAFGVPGRAGRRQRGARCRPPFRHRRGPARRTRQNRGRGRRLGGDPDARARPADFTQALFDLGATICTPRAPVCALCPWHEPCAARRAGLRRNCRAKRRRRGALRYGAQFWLEDQAGAVLLRRRPPEGLLGGMLELPGTEWRGEPWTEREALLHAPQPCGVAPGGSGAAWLHPFRAPPGCLPGCCPAHRQPGPAAAA